MGPFFSKDRVDDFNEIPAITKFKKFPKNTHVPNFYQIPSLYRKIGY